MLVLRRMMARHALPSATISLSAATASVSTPPSLTPHVPLTTGLTASPSSRRPFSAAPTTPAAKVNSPSPGTTAARVPTNKKVYDSAAEALRAAGLKDGQTLSVQTLLERTLDALKDAMGLPPVCVDSVLTHSVLCVSMLQTCRWLRLVRHSNDSNQRCARQRSER